MRSTLIALLFLALAIPALASAGALEVDQACDMQTGCFVAGAVSTPATLTVPYDLSAESAWLEGCIMGPCLCLVSYHDGLNGSFLLTELPIAQPGPWRLFAVSEVRWTFKHGDTQVEIRGSGTYRTGAPVLDQHRLVLDLERDGVSIGTLDSGDVAGALSFPTIEIQALTSGVCVQQGVQLAAKPVPEPDAGLSMIAGIVGLFVVCTYRSLTRC